MTLEAGVLPVIAQERLGHPTIAVTLGIYSHSTPILYTDAADLIAAKMLGRASRA